MPKTSLTDKLSKASINQPVKPLWDGPESNSDNGGVTQGLLVKFLNDREKLRVLAIEGLRPKEDFNHRIHYGQMWHTCEESLANSGNPIINNPVVSAPWVRTLEGYCKKLVAQFPMHQTDILRWYNICRTQFPVYIDWWKKHPQVIDRVPLLQEKEFKVPYKLPSGRVVILRGKWDAVDICGKPKDADYGIYLFETKTKGDLDAKLLRRQLTYDLQTNTYLVALAESCRDTWGKDASEIRGVRYNVVRRPLAGGKGSIRQKKNQSEVEFYDELGEIIKGAVGQEWGVMPDEHYFFMRWQVQITSADLEKFKTQTLNPLLEELCDWYEWVTTGDVWDDSRTVVIPLSGSPIGPGYVANIPEERVVYPGIHFRLPFGVYLDNDRISPEDEYIASGDKLGLERQTIMYRELTNEQ